MLHSCHRVQLLEYVRLIINENNFLDDVSDLLAQHGISVGNFLGQGLHGAAYEFDGDRVIKVSVARDEAAAQNHVRALEGLKQRSSLALATIYDVGILGPVNLTDDRWVNRDGIAFYYVMERLFKLPNDEVKLATRLLNDLIESPSDEKKLIFVARRVFKKDGEDAEIIDRTLQLYRVLKSSNVHHRDINSGALMMNNSGEYRSVDTESAEAL